MEHYFSYIADINNQIKKPEYDRVSQINYMFGLYIYIIYRIMFGSAPNSYPTSPRYLNHPPIDNHYHKPNYTVNEVSRLVNAPVR